MIKYYIIYCLAIMAIIAQPLSAQEKKTEFKKVNIGDALLDYTLTNLINYPTKSINFKDFKGKILILDFWTSRCTGCLASWPKVMKLQEEFKDNVKIVLVNVEEDRQIIESAITNQERIHGYKMNLTVSYGDKNLKTMFPHQGDPHVVFIDQEGQVKYITSGGRLNKETLTNMLQRKSMTIGEKTDDVMELGKPLFINGNVGKTNVGQNILLTAVITPYSEELDPLATVSCYDNTTSLYYGGSSVDGIIVSEEKKRKYPIYSTGYSRAYLGNSSAKDLFRMLYGKSGDSRLEIPNSRFTFRNIDSLRLVKRIDGILQYQNLFTVQFQAKIYIPWNALKARVINDLELFFNVKTAVEKQKKQCLVISRSNTPLTTYKEGGKVYRMGNTLLSVNNVTVEELVDLLVIPSYYGINLPIVDETNYKGKLGEIHFETRDKVVDLNIVEKELLKHGLKCSIEEREVDVLVITNKID